MKNLYKKIARAIFMHAYDDELCEIEKDIRIVELKVTLSVNGYAEVHKAIGKLETLGKLDLIS